MDLRQSGRGIYHVKNSVHSLQHMYQTIKLSKPHIITTVQNCAFLSICYHKLLTFLIHLLLYFCIKLILNLRLIIHIICIVIEQIKPNTHGSKGIKKLADKIMYIPNDHTPNYPFSCLILVVEKI